MRILQVSTADVGGGAESIASQLLQGYRDLGHDAWLAVGSKHAPNPFVWQIPHDQFRSPWAKTWKALFDHVGPLTGLPHAERMRRICSLALSEPGRFFGRLRGTEDFAFPATWHLAELAPAAPDIVQCHNLHGTWLPQGGYFDLRALPLLSHAVPTVLTLHDAWLLSGHCAHSFDCERWKTGCGLCPDLSIYPSVRRDNTAFNWMQKQRIFSRSHLYVSTPSQWLMRKVEASMLSPAIVESRVIPNGVDLTIFRPGDQRSARVSCGIPADAKVILCAARGVQGNAWKDFEMMRAATEAVGPRVRNSKLVFVVLGEDGSSESLGSIDVRHVPFTNDRAVVARYYQAADVYLHAARVDTFPNTILEAMACGVPVIATAVGGIPEQISDARTGWLVPPGDVDGMADRIIRMLSTESLRERVGHEAAITTQRRFDVREQTAAYVRWFAGITESLKRLPERRAAPCMVPAGMREAVCSERV